MDVKAISRPFSGFWRAVAVVGLVLTLTSCAVIPDPKLAEVHRSTLVEIQTEASSLGFPKGSIDKSCAMPFDCSANNAYQSTAYFAAESLTDEMVCEAVVDLAHRLNYTAIRRDFEIEPLGSDSETQVSECIDALSENHGSGSLSQSEGFVFTAEKVFPEGTVYFAVQVNSVFEAEGTREGERGYFFLMSTREYE